MKVIAEIGSNFVDVKDCEQSIIRAKLCGADAVKFQFFTSDDLYGCEKKIQGELPSGWLPDLYARSVATDIEFMCTAFSPKGYRVINQFVKTHKVASAEITAPDILDTVNGFRKPVLLSTGGATTEEITEALSRLNKCKVTLMYCVTRYPARIVDFRHLDEMRDIFGREYDYGYSDHSIDVLNIPSLARSHGATVIEKHVNFTPHTHTPDAPHSLNESEFIMMIKNLKGDLSPTATFIPCEWKRRKLEINGTSGYFRPNE